MFQRRYLEGDSLDPACPLHWVVPGLLSREEVAAWRAHLAGAEFEPALVNVAGGQALRPGHRRSQRFMEDDPDRAAWLTARLGPHLPVRLMNRSLIGLNERFRALVYGPGDYFRPHFDSGYRRPDGSAATLLTVMLYLSEGYQGGETVMHEDGAVIRARAGDALVFQHCQRHEGRTVRAGEKIAVRCDVFYTADPVEETSNPGGRAAV